MKLASNAHGRLSSRSLPLLIRILLSGLCLVFPTGRSAAQNNGLFPEPRVTLDRPAVIRVTSNLVLIPVAVIDGDDRPVAGLEKNRFRLFEDRVEQTITHFTMEDAPISIGFTFDASASMQDKLQQSREAVTAFLGMATPGDESFLVQFNDRVELRVDLTTSTEEVRRQLMFIQPAGRTALLDAIHFSINCMRQANNPRKALIIISDGGDNCSRHSIADLKKLAREGEVQIYAIGLFGSTHGRSQTPDEVAARSLLRDVAKQSGGGLFEVENVNQLPEVALRIATSLRTQYVLGYAPKEILRNGKYHRVDVKLAQPKGSSRLQASWRHGYYAPVE